MERNPVQLGVGTFDPTDKEREYLLKALTSGRLSYGPFSRQFERDFALFHDSTHAVFVNSGTSALSIAVACLKEVHGWKDGDEILVPALTFVATANVVLEHNLVPVFVDCDARTYNIDSAKMTAAITPRTRGVMAVHLFGQVADMDPVMAIARAHDLRVIEDSCETMGVTYKGRKAGSFGDISCFSTYVAHLIVTGVGGLAVTRDPELAEILRSLANHGRDSIYTSIDDDKDIDGATFNQVIKRRFRFVRRGYSFRATEMEAALGLAQLERLPEILGKRQSNAAFLRQKLAAFDQWLQLPWYDTATHEHAFMMFPIVIRKGAPFGKVELVAHLETWNVETRDMLPLINQPVYSSMNIDTAAFPVADWVNNHGFYIGCHQGLAEADLEYMVGVFGAFLGRQVMKKALITGITGQDGSYLAELLLEKGYEVHGIVRRASTFNRGRIEHLLNDPHEMKLPLRLHYGDLGDSSSLLHILLKTQPDEIYNLAAQSHVGVSFELPEYTGDITAIGTTRLLEALRSSRLPARFYQASSSELYGMVLETPQSEATPFYPRSPYACAKAYSFYMTRNYREAYGMFAVNGILFNHESPRRGENFVTRKITLSIARILAGRQDCLYLGNFDAKRDWGYAKEYVEGMWRMLQHDEPDDYVLATGRTASVREFLEICLQRAGIPFDRRGTGVDEHYVDRRSGARIVAVDPHYYRPAEVDLLLGNPARARSKLGWEARTSMDELATLMLISDCEQHGVTLPRV